MYIDLKTIVIVLYEHLLVSFFPSRFVWFFISQFQTTANAIRTVVDQGMQRAEVIIKGPGLGRDAALRAIRRSGILLRFIQDATSMPHNGCRAPKKRRV